MPEKASIAAVCAQSASGDAVSSPAETAATNLTDVGGGSVEVTTVTPMSVEAKRRSALVAVVSTLIVCALSIWATQQFDLTEDHLRNLIASPWAMPMVFAVNLVSYIVPGLSNAGWVMVIAAGAYSETWWMKIGFAAVASFAQTLGEMGAYWFGRGSRKLVADQKFYRIAQDWIGHHDRSAVSFIFVTALVPNPIFKVGAAAAGTLKYSAWKYACAVFVARFLRNCGIVLTGDWVRDQFLVLWDLWVAF